MASSETPIDLRQLEKSVSPGSVCMILLKLLTFPVEVANLFFSFMLLVEVLFYNPQLSIFLLLVYLEVETRIALPI
jgi:hypothetical protein